MTTNPTYLLNAFSIQMLPDNATVDFQQVDKFPNNLTSAIGHADTAAGYCPWHRYGCRYSP